MAEYYRNDVEALKKSWDLLNSQLDPKQRRDLRHYGRFTITKRGSTITVRANMSQINVFQETTMGRHISYCTMSRYTVPIWDLLLAQVLAIKYDWKHFKELAVKG